MANKMNLGDLGVELSEEFDYDISIRGRLGNSRAQSHERKIRAMLEQVVEKEVPEDEEVRDIDIRFDPWQRPKVTVWCHSRDFNHRNSQVTDQTFMVHGDLYRFKVDVRPF